jgi:micrococcal nuclease
MHFLKKYLCFCKKLETEINNSKGIEINNLKENENLINSIFSFKDGTDKIKYEDTIPFVPPVTNGLVIKVYDGDTITIASKLPYSDSPMYRFSVRLNGIDSPEIRTKIPEEKKLAIIARDALSDKIMGKVITLENVSVEKYGRILADVIIDGENMNNYMLDKKLAVKYDGGTKGKFEENFVN